MGICNHVNIDDCFFPMVTSVLCCFLRFNRNQIHRCCVDKRRCTNYHCSIINPNNHWGFNWNTDWNFFGLVLKNSNLTFLLKFNVLFLGGLFFTLLFLVSIMFRARLEWNTSWMWATKYLNGNYIAAIYVIVFLVSLISYAYALWKTWQLTKSTTIINKRRLLAFGWLIGAPIIVASNPIFFVSLTRLVTDRLFIF